MTVITDPAVLRLRKLFLALFNAQHSHAPNRLQMQMLALHDIHHHLETTWFKPLRERVFLRLCKRRLRLMESGVMDGLYMLSKGVEFPERPAAEVHFHVFVHALQVDCVKWVERGIHKGPFYSAIFDEPKGINSLATYIESIRGPHSAFGFLAFNRVHFRGNSAAQTLQALLRQPLHPLIDQVRGVQMARALKAKLAGKAPAKKIKEIFL